MQVQHTDTWHVAQGKSTLHTALELGHAEIIKLVMSNVARILAAKEQVRALPACMAIAGVCMHLAGQSCWFVAMHTGCSQLTCTAAGHELAHAIVLGLLKLISQL